MVFHEYFRQYYRFGSVARRANTPNSYFEGPSDTAKRNFGQYYRYGFQSGFSEEDSETGWNSFELRNYDPVIGRWMATDPARQHASPYLSFSNNPINRVDPDGGFDWYTDTDGNLRYDENVTSQADVDALGGGQYIDESFSDGINAYMPGGGIMNLETGQFSPTNFVASFTEPLYGRSSIEGYDYVAAVTTLNSNAESCPVGYCAKYVRLALEGGGLSTSGRPGSAKDYDTFLPALGFKEVPTANYQPMTGDIVVMQAIGNHVHGHIQMYNGEKWVSDYTQNGFYPYTTSRPTFQVFR
ncbi:RHS repeat-associated core domain-containing protein [Fulvivirga sp. M361]|uniref:RHS repeat-associated core domain-containing protein n=1 Tax=Fulvivirga sp. M361 TaxID=2594266 RepID=UPI0021022550|nr:RHS repeat-associated core domain-containing protein [Fulvivirga sp. M361]